MHVKYVYPRLSPEKNARPLLQPELVKDLTRHMIFCVACGVVPAAPRFFWNVSQRVTFSVSFFLVKNGGGGGEEFIILVLVERSAYKQNRTMNSCRSVTFFVFFPWIQWNLFGWKWLTTQWLDAQKTHTEFMTS